MNKSLTKSYTPTKLYGVFIVRVVTMLSLSVCDMNFQSFRGFDYSPISSLRQWTGGTFVRFRFFQGGFRHCFCCCDWLLRGLLFALWIDSTVAGLTAVRRWMKRGFGAAGFSWTPFLQIVVPWEVQVVLFCFHIPDLPDLQVPMVWRFHRDMNDRGIIWVLHLVEVSLAYWGTGHCMLLQCLFETWLEWMLSLSWKVIQL